MDGSVRAAASSSDQPAPESASAGDSGASAATVSSSDQPAPASSAAASAADPVASALGKRKLMGDWMGRPGDGGGAAAAAAAVKAKLQSQETAAKLSSIKSKLSKPKAEASTTLRTEDMRRTALSRDEILANQQRHEERLRATGKAVPYYRK